MQRVRRLASIAVGTALALTVLTGCRSDPGVAAYVGDARITDAKVTQIVDEVLSEIPQEQRAGIDRAALSDQVVHLLVLRAVVDRYAGQNDLTVPSVDAKAFGEQQGLPTGVEFTTVAAEYNAGLTALSERARSIAPTESDKREVYDHIDLEQAGDMPAYNEVKQYFNEEMLGQSLGLRALLRAAVDEADVSINPRYDAVYQLPVAMQGARSWFAVALGGSAPVKDVPVAVPATSGQD